MSFTKATKKQARLRMALIGPSGSGKTYTALRVACSLGQKVALVDTERGSASKYAGIFDFSVQELETFHPHSFINAIQDAEKMGFDVLVIDSLSHAWMGKDGALELKDAATARSKSKDSFGAWREVTPIHNALVDAILRSRCHVLVTMRSKTEYVIENVDGKQRPRKVGLAPVQRDGMEFEFDVVGDLEDASLVITKSRCPALSKAVLKEPGEDLAKTLRDWLTDGVPEVAKESPPSTQSLEAQSTDILREKVIDGEVWLEKNPKHPKTQEMHQKLAAIQAELTRRTLGDRQEAHS